MWGQNTKVNIVMVGLGTLLNEEKYYVDKSHIQGNGVFAKTDYPENYTIGKLHDFIGGKAKPNSWTELARKHNHSNTPNCKNTLNNGSRHLTTIKPVNKGEELTTDYTLQPDLEQPGVNFEENEMKPHIDGYRHYSPFTDLDFIIVPSNTIDCNGIVHDLVLVGDNGKIMSCKNDSGNHYITGAINVVELPVKGGENLDDIIIDSDTIIDWVTKTIKRVDTNKEIVKMLNSGS
tara:strand:+ start:1154 stop:1852 length:699 start_codon:yes stop_codon:yes gene_type:complete